MIADSKDIQHRWVYVKSFSAFAPYVWPKEVQLQLHFPLIGVCLVANRIVNVLTPMILGRLINQLSQSKAGLNLSWTTVGTYILLRYLDCPAGLNLCRHCLWLPLKKKMHIQLSSAAYACVMSQSSDFHDSKKSGKIWETIHRGNSITKLFELLSFEFLPMVIDLILAISIFWWIFDLNMVVVIVNVILVFFWSMQRTQLSKTMKQRDLNDSREWENQQLTESTLNWPTVSYFSRVKYESTRYIAAVTKTQNAVVSYQYASLLGSVCRSLALLLGLFAGCILVTYQVRRGVREVGDLM